MSHRFDWQNPYPTVRIPLFARNVVSTSHPLAAQAGLRMLLAGGSAVDAAIAAAAMLTVVEPVSCGLGSDAFAILWDGKELHGLNASGTAPQAWNLDYFRNKYGEDANGTPKRPTRGWDAVTVPGAISAWAALHARFGKLPFADVLEPAAEIAERGYTVSPIVAHKWAAAIPDLQNQPGYAQAFMPHGRAPEVGEKFRLTDAAITLRRIGQTNGRDFYEGELAERIAAYARECGGAMTAQDLRNYQPEWVKPITKRYRGYDLHEIPPNGQGIAALIALGILDRFDLGAMPVDSADSQHLQIEAMKLALRTPVDQIVADAIARRPDVLTAYAAEKASQSRIQAAESEFMPKVFVSASTSYNSGRAAVTAIPPVGQQAPTVNLNGTRYGVGAFVGVTIPLYDGGLRSAVLAQARNDAESASAKRVRTTQEAVRQIVAGQNTLQTSLTSHEAAQALVAAAQTTYDAALAAYRHGVGSITDVLVAQNQLLLAKNAYVDTYSGARTAAATLALATGAIGATLDAAPR